MWHQKNPRLIEQKVYRKRKRWKKYKKAFNKLKNSLKKEDKIEKPKRALYRPTKLEVPPHFSLLENTEVVLHFAETCKRIKNRRTRQLMLEFGNVTEISHGSMALMLSIIQDLNLYNILVSGTFPKNPFARERMIESGFLDFFRSVIRSSKHKNTILVSGSQTIDQESSAPEIESAMETVFGKKTRNQKLQGMIIEMMTNSVNHAFIKEYKNTKWYLSIFHDDKAKRVKFCFVDNGSGIIKTIRLKFLSKLVTQIRGEEIIQNAFKGEYGSRTRLKERGTGLITIQNNFEENVISKLKVITNNYFYDVERQVVTELKNDFNGTFYFWELDETCKNVNY